jgi:hypothetical protein
MRRSSLVSTAATMELSTRAVAVVAAEGVGMWAAPPTIHHDPTVRPSTCPHPARLKGGILPTRDLSRTQ